MHDARVKERHVKPMFTGCTMISIERIDPHIMRSQQAESARGAPAAGVRHGPVARHAAACARLEQCAQLRGLAGLRAHSRASRAGGTARPRAQDWSSVFSCAGWLAGWRCSIQKGTRVLISLWDSLMFGRVLEY